MSMLLYLIVVTLAGHELVRGPGAEPPEVQGFWAINFVRCACSYTLVVTLAGNELAWGPGAEPPEVQGFWAINNCQMSMLLYLIW